ncbi:penicillin-binding protein 1B [Granulicella aggregans]|uniref:Penicillin-binding protein 1B n=1 Tax=Granulicella aggregans TaxID=474949 RepID=A0A7W8E1M3_9BACT|nr:transglycosylase domain-containing protein [Granulicella aggregans]MBB5055577.1 penicillin-binding protein 1B [Granulicella aggregans]
MPVKLKLGNRTRKTFGGTILRGALIAVLGVAILFACIFGVLYFKYQKVVDDRLASGPLFANTAQIYSGSREVRPGQHLTAGTIARELKSAGYNGNPALGTFQLSGDSIQIKPGTESFHSTDGATIATEDGVVTSITAENGASLQGYKLEPQLITALSEDKGRVKRRLVKYDEIPPRMVEAVTSIEDRRFFEHGGVNYLRLIKCGVTDLVSGKKRCGGSTLTQQLAKNLFLSPEKSYKRKMIELLITFQLEARFNKQQLFEMYVNEMNLGHRGSFEINGVGEASQAFFGKDFKQLDLAECATLAGMFQRPSYYNPYRSPERVVERRNVVLDSMIETGAITQTEATRAKAEPLRLAPPNVDASEAPYFVDLVHDQLVQRIGDQALGQQSLRIYTSLDPDLQRSASEAVEAGMKNVDELIRKRHKKDDTSITYPQVALVAIDPHTGQILALVGGRNYTNSQLNHAVAERPTGSIFKPFVYATAYNTSLNGTELDGGVFTALTKLNNDAQDFGTGGQSYIPGNFEHGEYPGMVTAVQAIAHSLNIATIALAQKVGYENVAALARSAGIVNARGTPSVAIGTYNATPIDMAGAYTVFANNGVHLKPWLLASVRNPNGDIVADYAPEAKQVLDPRTAYLTQSLMENVMTFGTGAAARAHGFTAPAAGKTGTSHDVWFAGYSSNLLCVIWVGNDDYTDVSHGLSRPLQGADAAAPIWAEFMNRAIKLPQYSDMKSFTAPSGVQAVRIDKESWLAADQSCPNDYYISFLAGTAPQNTCSHMGESQQNFFQKLFGIGGDKQPEPQPTQPGPNTDGNAAPDVPGQQPQQKKNIFKRIFGGGDKPKTPPPNPDPNAPPQ